MYIVCVNILVKPEYLAVFIEATLDNAINTRREPGNLRFDVIQGEEGPLRFMLYEVYQSKADFQEHQKQAHYFRWRDTCNPWMAETRTSAKYTPIFYGDAKT